MAKLSKQIMGKLEGLVNDVICGLGEDFEFKNLEELIAAQKFLRKELKDAMMLQREQFMPEDDDEN